MNHKILRTGWISLPYIKRILIVSACWTVCFLAPQEGEAASTRGQDYDPGNALYEEGVEVIVQGEGKRAEV